MKKITIVLFTGILISALFSCTPEQILDTTSKPQACCDETGQIHPPPPPPVPVETGTGG